MVMSFTYEFRLQFNNSTSHSSKGTNTCQSMQTKRAKVNDGSWLRKENKKKTKQAGNNQHGMDAY